MSALRAFCLLLAAVALTCVQASAQNSDSSQNSNEGAELRALREALSQTQKQVASQQEEIEALKTLLSGKQPASAGNQGEAPRVINAALTQPVSPSVSSYDGAHAANQPVSQEG